MSDWRTRYMALQGHLIRGRERAGLSQGYLASVLGVSLRTFQRWEGGETGPDPEILFKWADLVAVEITSKMTQGEA